MEDRTEGSVMDLDESDESGSHLKLDPESRPVTDRENATMKGGSETGCKNQAEESQESTNNETNASTDLSDENISSSAIPEGKATKNKSTENCRSQYHSIPQLSSPSINSKVTMNCNQRISYKISDFVTPSRSFDENGKHPSTPTDCKALEERQHVESEDKPRDLKDRFSGRQTVDYYWKGRGKDYPGNRCEFSDEEEEFLLSSIRDGSNSLDDMSDVEISDGEGRSQSGSLDDFGQREVHRLPLEDSSQGQDALDDFVPVDMGREVKMEAKKARVENIIKTMTPTQRGSSAQSFPICRNFPASSSSCTDKVSGTSEISLNVHHDQAIEMRRPKRKQYIPQQVDPRSDQHDLPPAAKVCITEKDAIYSGLQKMQEQLVQMQMRFQQLNRENDMSAGLCNSEYDPSIVEEYEKGRPEREFNKWSDVKVMTNGLYRPTDNESDAKDLGDAYGQAAYLEHLAGVLKAEITRGVERLVDNFVNVVMKNYLAASTDVAKAVETELSRATIDGRVKDDASLIQKRKIKNDSTKMECQRKGEEKTDRHESENGDQIKDDLSSSDIHSPDDILHATEVAETFTSVHKKRELTPSPRADQSYYKNGSDIGSRLPPLPPPLPIQTSYHGSTSNGGSHSYEGDRTSEKFRKHYFDGPTGGSSFGIPQPPMPLFGPHHPPHLYYPPYLGKFGPNFLKDQEQMEPLPLIVGAPKKPKRTKVIDRVSPRAMRCLPQETTTQCDDGPTQNRSDSPAPGKSFHPSSHYHSTAAVLDTFPHPSMLPFGLTPPVAFHGPNFQQHSKFLQAMYSQMSTIGLRENTSSSIPSPSPKSSFCSAASDMVAASKSFQKTDSSDPAYDSIIPDSRISVSSHNFTSVLTPMHLRKAKLMFFYVRYPNSSILKVYFPDVKFNKNNTAQLVKWFSNFREFYYIQMEKFARQALAEGVKNAKDLVVTTDAELYRILVLHYNRNSQIEVPENFRFVVQSTLREFYSSIAAEKDQEPSWKKAIYKVISRMDDPVPEYFKSPNWMERLADG